jgi:ubiquitin C-terminal hydrolase
LTGFGYTPIGLNNLANFRNRLGDTSYFNALMQCLFATKPLTSYFADPNLFWKDLNNSLFSEKDGVLYRNKRAERDAEGKEDEGSWYDSIMGIMAWPQWVLVEMRNQSGYHA